MKLLLPLCSAALLAACSSAPKEAAKAEPPPAPTPITGRAGLQSTYPQARAWAPDAQPLQVRSIHVKAVPSAEGKAGAWEVTYVSPANNAARAFIWSSYEGEGLHEGVFGGPQQSWRAGSGTQSPISMAALRSDTPDALAKAMEAAADYLKKPGEKPAVNFLLELTPRHPNPVWVVMWGQSAGLAEYTVTVDANTGEVVRKG